MIFIFWRRRGIYVLLSFILFGIISGITLTLISQVIKKVIIIEQIAYAFVFGYAYFINKLGKKFESNQEIGLTFSEKQSLSHAKYYDTFFFIPVRFYSYIISIICVIVIIVRILYYFNIIN